MEREDLPRDVSILGGRFVLTSEEYRLHNETPKARYVAQSNLNKDKEFLGHNTTNLRQEPIRVILSFTAVKKCRVSSHDTKQAYLQSDEELNRQIYVAPKRKDTDFFMIFADEVLELNKPLYKNGDGGDFWEATVNRHIKEDMKMTPKWSDPSLCITILRQGSGQESRRDEAVGSMDVYVDEMLLAGSFKFQELTGSTLQTFEACHVHVKEHWTTSFFGRAIKTVETSLFQVSQQDYIRNIGFVPTDATFDQYRTLRAETAWTTHTRPDVNCCVNREAQVVSEPVWKCYGSPCQVPKRCYQEVRVNTGAWNQIRQTGREYGASQRIY